MKKDIIVTRIFNASVEQAWNAWVDPEAVVQWWGPDGFTSPSAHMDFREGGTSLVCMRAPESFGGQDMYSTWGYRKIVPGERIEFIQNLADKEGNPVDPTTMGLPTDFPLDMLTIVTFTDRGSGKTEMTVTEPDWEVGHMCEMSEMGMNQCLDKMGALFARE